MKKHIKKIILVISLVAVLVSSMVIPSFAYEISNDIHTWHDFMGEEDLKRKALWIDTDYSWTYFDIYMLDGSDPDDLPDSYVYSYVFDPLSFSNAGYYNGQVSFRLGGNPLENTYSLELGYFDLTEANRYQRVSTVDYNVTIEMYPLNASYDHYCSTGTMLSLPEYMMPDENIFSHMKTDNVTLTTNKFIVRVTVPLPSSDKYIFDNGFVMMLYPSVQTFDEIYKAKLEDCDMLYSSWEEAIRDRNVAEDVADSLRAENGNLLEEISNLTVLNEQYKYEASLVPTLSAEVDTLTEQKNILQNTVDQQKVIINSLQNELDGYDTNTDALRSLGNGIGDGFSKVIDSIAGLGFGNTTVGACIAVFVVIFVVFIIIKLVLR